MGSVRSGAVVLVVLGLVAAGCGDTSPEEVVEDVGGTLERERTAQIEVTTDLTGEGVIEPTTLSGEGEIDLTEMRAHITGQLRGSTSGPEVTQVSHTDEAKVRPAAFRQRRQAEAVQAAREVELGVVADRTSLYLRSEVFTHLLPRGADWLHIDLAQPSTDGALAAVDFARYWHPNPARDISLLAGTTAVERVGEQDVRGVTTTHYEADIDLQRAIDATSGEATEELERFRDVLTDSRLSAEVWIDGNDRLRRLVRTVEFELPDVAESLTQHQTLELYDFGSEVNVSPPASDETADLAGVMAGWGSEHPDSQFVELEGLSWGPPAPQIVEELLRSTPESEREFIHRVVARQLLRDGEPVAVGVVIQAVPAVAGTSDFRQSVLDGLAQDCEGLQELTTTAAEDFVCQGPESAIVMWFDSSLVSVLTGPDRALLEEVAAEIHAAR